MNGLIVCPNGHLCDSGCPQRRTPNRGGLGGCSITGGEVRAEDLSGFGIGVPADPCPVVCIRDAIVGPKEVMLTRCGLCGEEARQAPDADMFRCGSCGAEASGSAVRLCAPDCTPDWRRPKKPQPSPPDVTPWVSHFADLIRNDDTLQCDGVAVVVSDEDGRITARYRSVNAGYSLAYPIRGAPAEWVQAAAKALRILLTRHGLMG